MTILPSDTPTTEIAIAPKKSQLALSAEAYRWGREDANQGADNAASYWFAYNTPQWAAYNRGYAAVAAYVPFSDPTLRTVQFAEDRDDYIGI